MKNITFYILSLMLLMLMSCKDASKEVAYEEVEDTKAKEMLQGIWLNAEDEAVAFKVKGDSVIYADSTMASVRFAIINDSLVMRGYNEARYEIVKQTEHVFQFKNHSGDVVKYIKSSNPDDNYVFENVKVIPINQNQLIKRDSIVNGAEKRYRVYTQINPSTYKVIKVSYNQDGMQTETVYYDNIINICIYDGGRRVFSRDIHKQDLGKHVPADFLKQAVLSDIVIDKVSDAGVELLAYVCVPDSNTSYIVRIIVTHSGKMIMKNE